MPPLSLAFDITARDQASPVLRRVGDEAARTGKKAEGLGTSVGRGMKTATSAVAGFGSSFAGLAGVIAGAGIVRGIGAVVSAASNAEQSIGGVQAVFKDYANSVISNSKAADRALGLSANSYRELATVIGSQLKNAGLPLQELGDQTEKVIQIGADLAAQFGGSTRDAVEALSSAFRGETDPIERYGISLTAAAVGAKAVQLGLSSSKTELSQNAKLMATLALVTEQGADAQGAFAREADTSAGRAQRAAAQWENLKVAIGDQLLPAWSALVDVLGTRVIPLLGDVVSAGAGIASFFGSLPDPIKAGAIALGAFVLLRNPLTSMFGSLRDLGETAALKMLYFRDAMAGINTVAGKAKAGLSGFIGVLGGPWGIAITAVTVGLSLLVDWLGRSDDATRQTTEAQQSLADALEASRGAIDDNVRSAAAKVAQDEGLLDVAQRLHIPLGQVTDALLGQDDALGEVGAKLVAYRDANTDIGTGERNPLAVSANEAWAKLQQLSGQTDQSITDAQQLAAATEESAAGVGAVGAAASASVAPMGEAADAIKRWRDQLGGINESFVEPLSIYKEMLQEAAQATADATKSSKDSWQDYADSSKVSLDQFAQTLQEQITAQENWRTNLVTISQRGGAEVAQILANMGVEGAGYVQQMVDSNAEDFARMRDLLIRDARLGGEGATQELDVAMQVMARIGRDGSIATVQAVARELGIGVDKVRQIARDYGVALASGINPILAGLGKAHIAFTTRAGFNAGGGLWAGGYTGDGGKYTPMGIVHGGEFVFTKEQTAKAGKSTLAVWAKMLDGYAGGGYVSTSQVPRPPSTAPYRFPISTPGDATMDREYSETVSWVAAQAAARAAAAAASLIGAVPGAPAAAGGNVGLVQSLAAARGWVGAQWDALYQLIMHESGFRNTAQNPTSTAYGMFQFLDSTWASTGYGKTSDPRIQALAGFNYLGGRYGTPANAWAFWQAHHWYGDGTPFVPYTGLAGLHQGEAVLTKDQAAAYRTGLQSGGSPVNVRVFIGDRELTDMVRVEAENVTAEAMATANRRSRYNGYGPRR